MEARAIAKYVRISPLKVNYICSEIRGMHVDKALAMLKLTPKRGAKELLKVLESAIANAEHNLHLDRDNLYVKDANASDGPTMKRIRPKAKGMAYPILKRSSHLSVVVAEID
ncbi:MAG: 50S ribosomal protein L22 [Neofamilia sp.]